MDKIIGLGNALVDVLATLEDDTILQEMELPKGSMQLIDEIKLKQINEKFAMIKTHQATGGSAGNAILGLACLGAKTGFIGKIGDDEHGKFFKDNYVKNGIDEKLLVCDLPSGVASTFISPDGERTFGTYLGAASSLTASDLTLDMFDGYTYLFIEGYLVQDHEIILRAIELAKEAGLRICLDMASYNIVENDLEFFTMLIQKYVDIVFANEEEAKAFTGKEPEEALNEMSQMCSIAIVKVGAKGSFIKKGTEEVCVLALPIKKVIDTTGAGDYFAAGFLYGLTCG
ncbi:MAG: adenosine kinase, partial [Bacteroidaceae bacterium]